MAAITENYQLKWHSFGTHIHSCVASSLSSSNFIDVCLSTLDGHQFLAHRFILSACSEYLQQVLKIQSKVTTTLPLFIILPPEINYRTMKVLIQYMYSGEATVSKDILENVLKGGDLLKVKGLWRPRENEENCKKAAKVQEKRTIIPYSIPVPKLVHYGSKTEPETVMTCKPNSLKRIEQPFLERKTEQSVQTTNETEKLMKSRSSEEKKSVKDIKQNISGNENPEASSTENKDKEKGKDPSGNLQFFVIKEEPLEWSEIQGSDMEMVEDGELFNSEMTIKPELYVEDSEVSKPEEMYSPLTCELCSETFTLPSDWVKHIQTHTDLLPAKRQRRGRSCSDEDSGTFPPLHCDLCQEYFPTPAEWVRHIQSSHTEYELRASNNNANPNRSIRVNKQITSVQKMCSICNKKFPSHASMLIHKRTHTGEKPFMCEYCQKGFNVKSNLLRHLRTLHDRIINSTDVDQKESTSSNAEENEGGETNASS